MQQQNNQPLSQQEQINWIRLARSHNIGSKNFFRILDFFGSINLAIDNFYDFINSTGSKKITKLYDKNLAENEIIKTNKIGAKILYFCDKSYPKLLKEIYDPPPLLTCRGNISLLNQNILAIAGPRNASFNGKKFSYQIANDLGKYNLIIASGMARGIDSYVHQGSLEKGTIAVLAGGVDNIYPSENKDLYHKILEQGLIISENSISTLPKSINFPKRNRIISGLALGTIIIEASLRSGTLITAKYSLEQNRELMAVPGSPFDPRCRGSNKLIKEGAILIENEQDVINQISDLINRKPKLKSYNSQIENISHKKPTPKIDDLNYAKKIILENLSHSPIFIEELLEIIQIPANIANIILIQLELANIIENRNDMINLKQ